MNETVKSTYKEIEYTREMTPYMAYFQGLEDVLDFTITDSFADLGCNNGRLMEALNAKYPHIEMIGYDYFEWSKQYAANSIKEFVYVSDLSKPFTFKKQYDIVNCSEVGEHIPKEAEQDFIDNLVNATKDILLLTWSNQKTDHDGQHLNPRPKGYIIKELEKRGFSYWEIESRKLRANLYNRLDGIGYGWWAKNIMIFKRKRFADIHNSYFFQNISTDNSSHKKVLRHSSLTPWSLQSQFRFTTGLIHRFADQKKSVSFIRASDGDYLFLREIARGSATPGRRALTAPYSSIDMAKYRSLFWQNDFITLNLEKHEHRSWMKFIIVDFWMKIATKLLKRSVRGIESPKLALIIDKILHPLTWFGILPRFHAWLYSYWKGRNYYDKTKRVISHRVISSEVLYALVGTKWIFRNFPNSIGIIASEQKLAVIRKLMENKEYQQYLGIEKLSSYISIPQKGAADDLDKLVEKVGEQVRYASANGTKIFLVGAGSAKIGLLPFLRHYSNAIFIDVGAGIDAIGGMICQDRPYFAEWINYKLKDYDYSQIDLMDQDNPAWESTDYKTIEL